MFIALGLFAVLCQMEIFRYFLPSAQANDDVLAVLLRIILREIYSLSKKSLVGDKFSPWSNHKLFEFYSGLNSLKYNVYIGWYMACNWIKMFHNNDFLSAETY